jgi:repressor LexA
MTRPSPHLNLLAYIERYIREHGYSPSIDEMMVAVEKPRGAIQHSLRWLERELYIERKRGKARAIRLLRLEQSRPDYAQPEFEGVRIWGTIAAGFLTDVFPDSSDFLPFSSPKLKPGDFALQVAGDSMIGDHILDGSYVVMRPVVDPGTLKDGAIVAALINGRGTTLKHFHRNGNIISLVASNPKYPPIEIDTQEEQVEVQGTLLWVLREFD